MSEQSHIDAKAWAWRMSPSVWDYSKHISSWASLWSWRALYAEKWNWRKIKKMIFHFFAWKTNSRWGKWKRILCMMSAAVVEIFVCYFYISCPNNFVCIDTTRKKWNCIEAKSHKSNAESEWVRDEIKEMFDLSEIFTEHKQARKEGRKKIDRLTWA